MTKVTIVQSEKNVKVKRMNEMKPGEICKILPNELNPQRSGQYVMRSLSGVNKEIMILNNFSKGNCWSFAEGIELLVEEAPPGTKVIFEVVEEPTYGEVIDPVKEDALKHHRRMMDYAKRQPSNNYADIAKMFMITNEDWTGEYCSYCKHYKDTRRCKLATYGDCDKGFNCCDGLWIKLNQARTWEEWIKAEEAVIDYIEKNG